MRDLPLAIHPLNLALDLAQPDSPKPAGLPPQPADPIQPITPPGPPEPGDPLPAIIPPPPVGPPAEPPGPVARGALEGGWMTGDLFRQTCLSR